MRRARVLPFPGRRSGRSGAQRLACAPAPAVLTEATDAAATLNFLDVFPWLIVEDPDQLRGVWESRFTANGPSVFYACGSDGRILPPGLLIAAAEEDDLDVIRRLEAALDRYDPVRPRVALVR